MIFDTILILCTAREKNSNKVLMIFFKTMCLLDVHKETDADVKAYGIVNVCDKAQTQVTEYEE